MVSRGTIYHMDLPSKHCDHASLLGNSSRPILEKPECLQLMLINHKGKSHFLKIVSSFFSYYFTRPTKLIIILYAKGKSYVPPSFYPLTCSRQPSNWSKPNIKRWFSSSFKLIPKYPFPPNHFLRATFWRRNVTRNFFCPEIVNSALSQWQQPVGKRFLFFKHVLTVPNN